MRATLVRTIAGTVLLEGVLATCGPDSLSAQQPTPLTGPPALQARPAISQRDSLRVRERLQESLYEWTVDYQGPPQLDAALADLEESAPVIPGDMFVIGHRVGLRVGLGQLDGALEAAHACVAVDWWCAALLGFVHHVRGEFTLAETAFDDALARMPPAERCRWLGELRLILSDDLERQFGRASCQERLQLERRVWWLADPLFMQPGNDRRSEHFSRIVALELYYLSRDDEARTGSSHLHTYTMATGWYPGWHAIYRGASHSMNPGYGFVPLGSAGTDPLATAQSDWPLRGPSKYLILTPALPPRVAGRPRPSSAARQASLQRRADIAERHDPSYGPLSILDEHQTTSFLRSDSAIVVAAIGRNGPVGSASDARFGLYLGRDEVSEPVILSQESIAGPARFRATVPAERHLVSLEVLAGDSGAARTRFGLAPPVIEPGRVTLSDLLLYEWQEELGDQLDDVARHMLGSSRVRQGSDLGVYWEMYTGGGDQSIGIDLLLSRNQSALQRLGTAFHLTAKDEVHAAWEDRLVTGGGDYAPRALNLALGELTPGEYALQVTVLTANGEVVTARRGITIVE